MVGCDVNEEVLMRNCKSPWVLVCGEVSLQVYRALNLLDATMESSLIY